MIFIRAFQLADIIHMSRFLALAAHEDDTRIVLNIPIWRVTSKISGATVIVRWLRKTTEQ